jgi:riboflavin synthase
VHGLDPCPCASVAYHVQYTGDAPSPFNIDHAMVFTGIVEELGTVVSNSLSDSIPLWDGSVGPGWLLTVSARIVLDGAYNGCSIAVNGTCLTVISFSQTDFTVGLAPETLLRTNLGDASPGSLVNLERSMRADARISGHSVQGHVDGTGSLLVSVAWP